MDQYTNLLATISLTMGVGWASGINLYAAVLTLGVLGSSGNMVLPEPLLVVQEPMVMVAAAVMFMVEFFADKMPGLDTGWDAIHTFIRIPAGAMLAAGAVGEVNGVMMVTAGLLGGGVATVSHATKAGSRVLINTSPEPVTNWLASVAEDVMVIGGIWLALQHPLLFLLLFILFLLLVAWLLPRIWQGIKKVAAFISSKFRSQPVAG